MYIVLTKSLEVFSNMYQQDPPEMYPPHRQISPTTIIVFMTLFVFSTFALANSMYRRRGEDKSWDLLIFTQNWPVSVCEKYSEEGKNHTCYKFPNNTWTIHGLWPTKLGTIGPNFCDPSRPFSPEAIYGIESELEKYWSPVENHHKKYAFWAHEWEKHGTCASVLPQFSSEFGYFYKVLQLLKKYSMNNILTKAGVNPGQTYNVTEIWDGVKSVLKKNPQVVCFEGKNHTSTLLEVRICFDKSLNLADCDGTVVGSPYEPRVEVRRRGKRMAGYHNLTNCKIEKLVQYPPGLMRNIPQVITKVENMDMNINSHPLIEKLKAIHFAEWFTG